MLLVDRTIVDCPIPALRPMSLRFMSFECLSIAMASQPKTVLDHEVHLWHAALSAVKSNVGAPANLLSVDELDRMNRFHFEADRQNFFFYRTMLRTLLSSYLGVPPAELRFAYSAHGKPTL